MNIMDETNDEKPAVNELCRLCAHTDKQFIPIFQGEGIEHNIAEQIQKYLPIVTVTKADELPLQICYQCTSTLLAWHNFFEQCRVADHRLREITSNVKCNEDDGSFLDYTDDFHDDFEDQTVNEGISDNTQEEIVLPEIVISDTQVMETSDNNIVDISHDVIESANEDHRFVRKTTNERGTKDDLCLAPKETAPQKKGEECGRMGSGGDASSFYEGLNATDQAESSICAQNEGRSVRCQHCPMVLLSTDHLARHMSSSHYESPPISSSPRESAITKAAEPEGRPKRRMSERSMSLASRPKVKKRKVDATEEPPRDAKEKVNDCAGSPRVSSFRCPKCPKVCRLARGLKRHSTIHERLTRFDAENENNGQNGQVARDSILKTEKFDVDPSADKVTNTEGKLEYDSDEPSPSIGPSKNAIVDAAAVTSSSPKPETSSAEQPASESKPEKRACRSRRRSTAKTDEKVPQPSLPLDTIVCSVCQETCDDEATFAEHQLLKHSGTYPAACDVCEMQFSMPTLLRVHKIANHRSQCGRTADEKDPFSRWYVYVDAQKHLKCDQCNFNSLWSHKSRFLEHYRIHTGERPYTCDQCNKQFRTRGLKHKHVACVHQGVKEHACDLCGRRFSDKRYMEDHRRIHTGEKPYVCDLCGKTFRQSASLFIHKELHKGLRRHACYICGKRFTTSSSLNIHIKRHVGERNFVCTVCGKAFVDGKHLRDHSTVHSDERPFACELCGARFKLRKHLKQHGRTHKRDFPG